MLGLEPFREMLFQLLGREARRNQFFVFIASNGDKIGGDELGAQQVFCDTAVGAWEALAEAVV